jgi:hypothetical protein
MVDLVLLAAVVCILGILLVGRYTFNPELTEFEARVIREAHLQRQEAHAAERRELIWVDAVQPEIASQDLLVLAAATQEGADEATEVREAREVSKASRPPDSVSA